MSEGNSSAEVVPDKLVGQMNLLKAVSFIPLKRDLSQYSHKKRGTQREVWPFSEWKTHHRIETTADEEVSMVFSSSNLILCPPFSTETQVKKIPHSHKIQQQQLPVKKWNEKKREKALMGRRERVGTWGKKGKYIFYMWGASPKFIFRPGLGAARKLGTCCCVHSKWRGGERKNKNNKNESSPIQLGEGTSTLRQGFIQEGLSPSLDERKSHSSSACVM